MGKKSVVLRLTERLLSDQSLCNEGGYIYIYENIEKLGKLENWCRGIESVRETASAVFKGRVL